MDTLGVHIHPGSVSSSHCKFFHSGDIPSPNACARLPKRLSSKGIPKISCRVTINCYARHESYSVPGFNWRSREQEYSPGWGSPVWRPEEVVEVDRGNNGASASVNHSASTLEHILTPDGRAIRPHRIILVRHGQSEGNVCESAYTRIPDSKIALTKKGWDQAVDCGQRIRQMVEADGEDDWKVYFYVSPYTRTIQTLRGLGLAFERDRIAGVREEPRIREQDFGNFQDREKMRVEKGVRLRYGRFFYRFPDGESAADVYDRVTGFRETLRADMDVGRFQRPDSTSRNMNLVLVSHGLTLRVFLMRWFKWTVEQFEGLHNFSNTGMMVMQLGRGGRYSLRVHHTRDELRAFGMTEKMIDDQEWQLDAEPGDLNFDWETSGPAFFDHFDHLEGGRLDEYECTGLSEVSDSAPAASCTTSSGELQQVLQQ